MVCLERRITPHIVSRSASAHHRRSIKQWHHCSSSGVEDRKEIQFEKLVIQSIFPIEMILNKYFLNEFLFSSKLSNSNRYQHQTSRNLSPSHATSWLQTSTILHAAFRRRWTAGRSGPLCRITATLIRTTQRPSIVYRAACFCSFDDVMLSTVQI